MPAHRAIESGTDQISMALPETSARGGLLECGVHEVGIGSAFAGVFAAACIRGPARRIIGLRDSNQFTPERRQQLSDRIKQYAFEHCVATANLEEVNELNIFGPTMLAMQRAVAGGLCSS